jgi:hypothetical protein
VTTGNLAMLLIGGAVGSLAGIPGWKSRSALGALILEGLAWLWKVAQAAKAPPENFLATFLGYVDGFSFLGIGIVAGLVVFQAGGAALITVLTFLDYRDGPNTGTGALERATERARQFLSGGLLEYNAWRDRQRDSENPTTTRDRTLEFLELMMRDLARLGAQHSLSREEAERACRMMGGVLLRTVFEASGNHADYRLAIFEVCGDKLVPVASTGPADAPHATDNLDYPGSFLGAVIQSGRPDIWVRGKSFDKPYQKRGKCSYKCFYAQPVPCDSALKWGGFTIDYIGKYKVFTEPRRKAIRAFARYVNMVYALAQKGVCHDAANSAR